MKIVTTAVVVAATWGLPLYALVYNRLHPDYSSALGVAYAWYIGLALGMLVAAVMGLASLRWPVLRFEPLTAALAWLALFFSAQWANTGQFSVVS